MADIELKKAARKITNTQLVRLAELIETEAANWSRIQISIKLNLLENCRTKFEQLQTDIELLDESELDFRFNFEDSYSFLKEKLLALKASKDDSNSVASCSGQNSSSCVSKSKSILPAIQLPKFDGSYSQWSGFINMFDTLVNSDTTFSNIERFQILKSCLVGPAAVIIQSLDCTDENYSRARDLLHSRYNNKRLIFGAHIQKLMKLSVANKGSVNQLRDLVDLVNGEVRALHSMGSREQIAEAILINIVSSKLDSTSKTKWEESASLDDIPKWDSFMNFLERRCQTLEHIQGTSFSLEGTPPPRKRDHSGRLMVHTSIESKCRSCFLCQSTDHLIRKCPKFLKSSPKERYQAVKRTGLCINCLKPGHSVKNCKSSACLKCTQKHHTSLHFGDQVKTEGTPSQEPSISKSKDINMKCLTTSHTPSHTTILIATALVNVSSPSRVETTCRVLLDSASQTHLITERLVQQLSLKKIRCGSSISGVAAKEIKLKYKTRFVVKSRTSEFSIDLEALVLPNITSEQPSSPVDITNWEIPSNIELADPLFNRPARIDILLGAEVFMNLLCVGQIKLGPQKPILQKTLLGWVVSGKTSARKTENFNHFTNHLGLEKEEENESLNNTLKRFWEIEEIHRKPKPLTAEEEKCEEHFINNTTRNTDGKFIVRLPLKESSSTLGSSHKAAEMRYSHLKRKFSKNDSFRVAYQAFMDEYISLNHMELFNQEQYLQKVYHMPHHGVQQSSGNTVKLRVVFDASCKTSTGKSLNDILMVGPVVQDDLFSILCRFRKHRFVLTADIVKMYRQILVHPDDAPLQSILWENSGRVKTYLLNTVTYGTASAPFLATRCIKQLSIDNRDTFPIASSVLERDVYVDDILTGGNSLEEVDRIKSELVSVLGSAGMHLHKWCSNSKDLLAKIEQNSYQDSTIIDDSHVSKTLGMMWHPLPDYFSFKLNKTKVSSRITKRSILSILASLFDPLGLVNPIIVSAKILMQEIWKLRLDWDESVPLDLHSRWLKFLSNLETINDIKIERFVMLNRSIQTEIHGFADASQAAYGACIYIRCTDESGQTRASLLCSKSRVAPVKTQTLPRLELCAAHLLVELVEKAVECLKIGISSIYCWSDSSVTLAWIAAPSSTWNVFVSHRVSKIQTTSQRYSISWRHVRSHDNPADILSRGARPDQLLNNQLWFHGPNFLQSSESSWPNTQLAEPVSLERKKTKQVLLLAENSDLPSSFKYITSHQRTVRVFAYVIRFITKCRNKSIQYPSKELQLAELTNSEITIIKAIQHVAFNKEISKLRCNSVIDKRSHLYCLSPFLDVQGLLRVGGRLEFAELEFDAKHPILLPRSHIFTKALVEYLHTKHLHVGALTLHTIIRQKYWIPNGRQLVREILHKCIRCFRSQPSCLRQIMGQLPRKRVQIAYPFLHTGVDYCGPFLVKSFGRGRSVLKTYVALFVCFATKAVHLEIVMNLSTEAFISALKRFISRRGKCASITSDNATNFVGAKRELKELRDLFCSQHHNDLLVNCCNNEGIEWKFIPPRSPHFGGLWESSIKKAKLHLTRTLNGNSLNLEEFQTFLIQVEAVINSRPLTAISADPNDPEVLTPGHFLIGRHMSSIIEPDLTNLKLNQLSRWQLVERLHQSFWKRWSKEYLITLQQRTKWKTPMKNIEIGAIVVLKDENLPPRNWLLGKVIHTIPGSDGYIRVVDVQTQNGVLRRSINKICKLPIEENVDSVEVPSRRGAC